MKLETAILVPGSETPAGDGVSGAVRCVLTTAGGARRAAILKRIPKQAVLAEAFSALLLRAWGLTVPDPYLVPEGNEIYFASADATYPSLKHRFGIKDLPNGPAKDALVKAACHIVASLPQTPLAIVADEAIDNRDRNLGNVLWDGAEEAWIDHELALGLAAHLDDLNKLAMMVNATDASSPISQSAVAAWMSLDRSTPEHAANLVDAPHFAEIVSKRLVALGTRLLNRFPAPNDLLSGA